MTPKKEHLEDRVDQLEDQRYKTLCDQVGDIHKLIVGNGNPGLIRQVAVNRTRIKILTAILLILLSCVLGSGVKTSVDIKSLAEKIDTEVIEELLSD